MANTLNFKEWKKKYPKNYFLRSKTITDEASYNSIKAELTSLTGGGDYEAVYELAQSINSDIDFMDVVVCDTDDIFELIGY